MADPLDFTNKYNTPLPAGKQAAYEAWARQNGQDPIKGKYDYDLQGAFLSNAGQGDRGHFSDQFKKPNHPTFSNESQYHGADGYTGGSWLDNNGKSFYLPSTTNLKFRSPDELKQYFQRVEPDTQLLTAPAMAATAPGIPPAPTPQMQPIGVIGILQSMLGMKQ